MTHEQAFLDAVLAADKTDCAQLDRLRKSGEHDRHAASRRRTVNAQQSLFGDERGEEHPDYLSRQLITYIGNKRSLLGHIDKAVFRVKERLGKNRLRIFDAFAGSGVVSRFFKRHAELLVSNDLESFAAVAGRCFLRNRSSVNLDHLRNVVDDLNERVDSTDFHRGSSRNSTRRATRAISR